ncbi:elongation factor G [Desulfovibrio inopinatus]|uniref:elongation factor G n=1 Tax=Desulfovibrio inopinatus TaxID=102109 RepID=UPI0003F9C044|nr:elongation factor G [Desulfovibrio inopinatus]
MATKKGQSQNALSMIRNIGIIAHIDAGKTTLSERILYYSKRIHRMGEVHEGTATMDFMPEEQERGITIASACTACIWGDHRINIIDTPGHVDFTIEVERALRVLDGAVGVFCAVSGVEPQSETVWRQSQKYGVPKLAFINKMDRLGADFEKAVAALRDRLHANPLALQIPVGQGQDFEGIIDLVHMKRLRFDAEDMGETYSLHDLDENEAALAQPWRDALLEAIAESDDSLLELYVAGEDISTATIQSTIRGLTLSNTVVPVLCGSALKNIGVQPVLDAVCAYLPSPADREHVTGIDPKTHEEITIPISAKEPLTALAFKVTLETGRKLVLMRIYSGKLEAGQDVYNVTQEKVERVARLFHLHADHKEKLDVAYAGDIIAAAGMRFAKTGDTLTYVDRPVVLETISGYKPVISLAIEPRNTDEANKLLAAMEKYLLEDPTLTLVNDEETGQIVLSGMGELHLEVVLDRLRREYKLEPRAGNPQVVYQETILTTGRGKGLFHRELGEQLHHGHVVVEVSPLPRDGGQDIVFEVDIDLWPPKWIDAVSDGIDDALQSGPIKGFPVQDVRVRVVELERLEGQSTEVGFRMAAHLAVKDGLQNAGLRLMEPLMDVEISVPEEFVGEIIGLLGTKGAKIENMFDRGGIKIVKSLTPLRSLFGFSTQMRSATQGRAGMVMKFSRFDVLD